MNPNDPTAFFTIMKPKDYIGKKAEPERAHIKEYELLSKLLL